MASISARTLSCILLAAACALGDAEANWAIFDESLSADDECAADGKDSPHCSLHALQVKTELLAEEEGELAGDPCHSGMVGKMRNFAPECIDHCQAMCNPMQDAVKAYFRRGGAQAVKGVVCAHQGEFSCALSEANLEKCRPIMSKARQFGFTLPDSLSALHSQCR